MKSRTGLRTVDLTLSGEIQLRRELDGDRSRDGYRERRAKPRIQQRFPASVRGTDVNGHEFQINLDLENMSSSGLYLRMPRKLNLGDQLNLVVEFSNGIKHGATAALLGRVLRVEPGIDGLNGIALEIQHYKFV